MSKLIMQTLMTILLIVSIISAQTFGSFTDSRDNKIYKTIQIGEQVWMAENLKFSTKIEAPHYGGDTYSIGDFKKYGGLYQWRTACKVCPEGWHLPSRNEWYKLINNFGDIYTDKFLTSSLKEYRKIPKEERKERKRVAKEVFTKMIDGGSSGFDVLFGGYFEPFAMVGHKNSFYFGTNGYYWTSDKVDDKTVFGKAYGFIFNNTQKGFGPFVQGKRYALSVRCVKDTEITGSEDNEIQE